MDANRIGMHECSNLKIRRIGDEYTDGPGHEKSWSRALFVQYLARQVIDYSLQVHEDSFAPTEGKAVALCKTQRARQFPSSIRRKSRGWNRVSAP
jgi:hypothetical protein